MNEDARTLPAAAQEEKRKQAVRLHKKNMNYREISEVVGVTQLTVGKWIRKYKADGLASLKSRTRGRPQGVGRWLDVDQEKSIRNQILDKTPDQLKLDYALWTRKSVQEFIEQETGIKLAIRTVGKYLSLWGFTPQKPLRQAYEQRPTEVTKWLKDSYPDIKAQAKQENAEIYWGDETGLRNDCQHERGYAPKGKTPVIRLNANRVSTNMISAITNQGTVRFQVFEGTMNAQVLIGFCKRLIKSAQRKVYLILDNLRVHHAKVFKAWLAKHEDEMSVYSICRITIMMPG